MKWLVDNALSPSVADLLVAAGHDAVHVRALGLHAATDSAVFRTAVEQDRVLISADTDFGTILTLQRATRPSVVLFRHGAPRKPADQASLLLANLESIAHDLAAGAIVVFHRDRIRVRRLVRSAYVPLQPQRLKMPPAAVGCRRWLASPILRSSPSPVWAP